MAMIETAALFLDKLEQTRSVSEDLPIPHVMRRICTLLQELLETTESCNDGGRGEKTGPVADFKKALRTLEFTTQPVVVDIQCLMSNEGHVVKEFSAESEEMPAAWITVKSPPSAYPKIFTNDYVVNNVNGIEWRCGEISEQELRDFTANLFANGRRVFVKGRQKIDILKEKCDLSKALIEEIDEMPDIKTLRKRYPLPRDSCPYHRHLDANLGCALKNTHALLRSGSWRRDSLNGGGGGGVGGGGEEEEDESWDNWGGY